MRDQKAVKDSISILSQVMIPKDASHYGNVHGGVIMKLIDEVAFVAASRHSHRNVVTASIDSLNFENPVHIGDLVSLRAQINYVGTTSMEIEVNVKTERLKTGEIFPVATAYLTMVALNDEGHPVEVPQLILQTEEEKRKYQEAKFLREERLRKFKKSKGDISVSTYN